MAEDDLGLGRRYLKDTRYSRAERGPKTRAYPRAHPFKEYPEAQTRVKLTPTVPERAGDLWQTLARRRSLRDYVARPLNLEEISALCWATQGITLIAQNFFFRASPSAGALYPVETYLAAHQVEGLESGIWHLNILDFALELINPGDHRRSLAEAGLSQTFLATAGAVFIWTGILNRAMWKYRERAIRYLFLDAGHICQNLMLAATALNLGCCPVGAFFDDELEALVGVDGVEEVALYLASVGPLSF
jgi:SagB-type dehydrogenase family enzyme